MKILLFCKFSILFISVLLPQSAFAQDYIRWGLPEGATARLGKGSIFNIAYSPDGARLAVAGYIGVWIYDAYTGAEIALFTEHKRRVHNVTFSPDGGTLASGSADNAILLWNAVTGAHKQILKGHTMLVDSVAFSPDGGTLASGSRDHTIRLWDAFAGTHKMTLKGHTESVGSVAFSPDGGTRSPVGAGTIPSSSGMRSLARTK